MKDKMVRILELGLFNYMNVSAGEIDTANLKDIEAGKVDIRGIYGQNGSGKTAVITAAALIKRILLGFQLPEDINQNISYGEDETKITITFYIDLVSRAYKVLYSVTIQRDSKAGSIQEEAIHYWEKRAGASKWEIKKGLIINNNHIDHLRPLHRNNTIVSLYASESEFLVSKKMAYRNRKSFIFSDEFQQLLNANLLEIEDEYEIVTILREYSITNLFIIDNKQLALSDANLILPINFKNYSQDKGYSLGVLPIRLMNPSHLPAGIIDQTKASLCSINKVLNELIPGLQIGIEELSRQISKDGQEEVLIELLSCREDVKIPIRYESDGIKKIVAVLHMLIAMFNNKSMTVFIDELDSGIFEYLLGEILLILEERGKGQLVFTSHNLRPLEVLQKNNLIFTTTNPQKRYIRLKNVKTNNNLRDLYYRDLILGGQDEVIYDKTNSAKIARAFQKAGE